MKRVLVIIGLLIFILLPTSIQASEQLKEVSYTIMKHHSQDVSIANDYFNKPISIEQQDDAYIISFSVNHSHWITDITLDGQMPIKKQVDDKLEDTVTYYFKVSKLTREIPATVKVDIEEQLSGEDFSYHNNYPITFKLDIATTELNHHYLIYGVMAALVVCSIIGYRLVGGGKKIEKK